MKLFNWKFKEEDIHDLIIELYQSLGYECISFHKSGASVENGVDILATKGGEEIAFCVKIKPQKADIIQLKRFVEKNNFKRKIYVSIEDPTRPFFDELNGHDIERMNAKKLHKLFVKHKFTPYVRRYLFSHETIQSLEKIIHNWHSIKGVEKRKIEKSDLDFFWEFKDRAVNIHKVAKVIYDINEKRILNILEENEETYRTELKNILDILDYMKYQVEKFESAFLSLKHKNPSTLSYMWSVCRPRSDWGRLLHRIDIETDSEEISKEFFRYFYNDSTDSSFTFFTDFLKRLYEICEDFEDGVDWVFQDRVRD